MRLMKARSIRNVSGDVNLTVTIDVNITIILNTDWCDLVSSFKENVIPRL